MQTYTPAKLSAKRYKTPEGFLVCRDVAMARVGEMIYGPGETPIPVDPATGRATIERLPDVVFHPDTMDSFVGKDVTFKHPPTAIGTDNWREVTAGHIMSVRRGTGDMADFMIGDIMVKDADAILEIENGAPEVSNGYDAAYEQTGPGRGRQTKIVGNHIAILPKGTKGRCGSMCYIGDQAMDFEEPKKMTTKSPALAAVLKLFGAKDEAEAQTIVSQMATDQAVSDAVAPKDAEIATLTAQVASLTTELVAAKDAKSTPAAIHTADSLTALRGRVATVAEILHPGFQVVTVDAAGDMAATFDALCGCQRQALEKAHTADDTAKAVIENVVGAAPDFAKMTADEISGAFFAAGAALAAMNNESVAKIMASTMSMNPMQDQFALTAAADERSRKKWARPAATV